MLPMVEQVGISVGVRAHSTFEAALDVYAPPSQAGHRLRGWKSMVGLVRTWCPVEVAVAQRLRRRGFL